jgi:hypothetical protein
LLLFCNKQRPAKVYLFSISLSRKWRGFLLHQGETFFCSNFDFNFYGFFTVERKFKENFFKFEYEKFFFLSLEVVDIWA